MDAANKLGIYIPFFCYHKKLSIAANCRMCLVHVEKAPKALPACATPAIEGMKVWRHCDQAIAAQEMTRCIQCTRCVRFTQEIAGFMELGMIGRGEHAEIVSFIGKTVDSELSGNTID